MGRYLSDRYVAKIRLDELLDAQYHGKYNNPISIAYIPDLERSKYIIVDVLNPKSWRFNWHECNKCIYIPCVYESFNIILKEIKV